METDHAHLSPSRSTRNAALEKGSECQTNSPVSSTPAATSSAQGPPATTAGEAAARRCSLARSASATRGCWGRWCRLLPFDRLGPCRTHRGRRLWFLGPVLVFVLFPVLDIVDRDGPLQPARQRPEVARTGPLLPLLHLPFPAAAVRLARVRVLDVGPRRPFSDRRVGLAVTLAMVSGIAITNAHELGHKHDSLEHWLRRSRSRRPATATSTSSTTAATTCASPPPRTPRAHAWARASTRSCRAPCPAACAPPGASRPRASSGSALALVDPQRHAQRLG